MTACIKLRHPVNNRFMLSRCGRKCVEIMMNRGLFRNPKNQLEGNPKLQRSLAPSIADEMSVTCPACKKTLLSGELSESLSVCPKCGYHFRINARQRINMISDADTFNEVNTDLQSENLLGFPEYDKKLNNARLESAEKDAVVCGTCGIGGL